MGNLKRFHKSFFLCLKLFYALIFFNYDLTKAPCESRHTLVFVYHILFLSFITVSK